MSQRDEHVNQSSGEKSDADLQQAMFEFLSNGFETGRAPEEDLHNRRDVHNTQAASPELLTLLALASLRGVGFVTLRTLFDSGFLHNYLEWNSEQIAKECAALNLKPLAPVAATLANEKESLLEIGRRTAEKLAAEQIHFIPKGHQHYPSNLLGLDDAPRWLFVQGNVRVLHTTPSIAVVGTREPSPQGKEMAFRCAAELTIRGFVVISGLAQGIDEQAHWGTVTHYGQTVGILGHGIQNQQAAYNRELATRILECDGAIVSEYLPKDPPSRDRYLRRNELIAAIAEALIPIETPSMASGTGATVRRARKLGKPVIGIIPANSVAPSLRETEKNLVELGYPVFTVMGKESSRLWQYLQERFPHHKWESNRESRQDRFFRKIVRQIQEADERLTFTVQDIDRLAQMAKKSLRI